MKVVVTGGRDYDDADTLMFELSSLQPSIVGHGGASGADQLAAKWCQANGIQHVTYAAAWTAHGRKAGPMRNGRMLRHFQPDIVLAFPGGRGTADCVRQAQELGIEVREVRRV